MGSISLFIATSLDGYIADADGGVGWLPDDDGGDYGYDEFYAGTDALAMGRRTYDQVLGFGDWPYPGKPTYVFTNSAMENPPPGVQAVRLSAGGFARTIATRHPGRIWLVGGADLFRQFHSQGLVDEYILFVIPTVLGAGIRLFREPTQPAALRLVESRQHSNGLVELCYRPDPVGDDDSG